MLRFISAPVQPHPDDLCLVHSSLPGAPVFCPGTQGWWTPRRDLRIDQGANLGPGQFLGESEGRPLWALEVPGPADPSWTGLRMVMAEAEPDQVKAAVRAAELAAWRRDHRFCGICGTPTQIRTGATVADCPSCSAEFWPRVTPAVIMLVHRGDEVLLARHSRHSRPGAPTFHTCLAGFVESGETLEDAVAREVFEEVGVKVGRPVYIGSQPWPFPHSLMAGFLVPWESGVPTPDGEEIAEAGWYRRDNLPDLPLPLSIARQLIRHFFHDPDL